jgi:hypothetical protein
MSTDEHPDPSPNQERGEYIQDQREKERRAYRRDVLETTIDEGYRAIADDDHYEAAAKLLDVLIPSSEVTRRSLQQRSDAYRESNGTWDASAVRAVMRRPVEYCSPDATPRVEVGKTGGLTRRQQRTVERAYDSVVTALSVDGIVRGDVTIEVPAYEYRHEVGKRFYRPMSSGRDTVQLVDRGGDLTMALFVGGTGSGKSTSGKTVGEDRIAKGHKLIDLVDTQRVENGLWDCESRHDDLNDIRREANVDVGFEAYDEPEQEILLPLSERIDDAPAPYNTEDDEFVVQPFTIPAAELSYRQLSMMLHHSTTTQENHLRQAYDRANRKWDDYTLGDIADLIRADGEIGDKVSDRIVSSLRALQKKSFIRDKKCPHALDWFDIMQDADVVTSFSVRTVREQADKKAILAYLVDSLREARDDLDYRHQLESAPPLTVMMREMHFISPSSQNQSEQDSESTLEKYMVDTMQSLSAMHRHADVEIIADSQSYDQQLHKSVKNLFQRVFVFGHRTNHAEVKKIFREKESSTDPADSIARWSEPGKCAAITPDGYFMPIQMHPPRHHHIDAKSEGNGLAWRVRHLEDEEFREVPWSGELPPRLQFSRVASAPLAEWADEHVRETNSREDYIPKDEVVEHYNAWANANGRPERDKAAIGRYMDWEERRMRVDGDRQRCWAGIEIVGDRS